MSADAVRKQQVTAEVRENLITNMMKMSEVDREFAEREIDRLFFTAPKQPIVRIWPSTIRDAAWGAAHQDLVAPPKRPRP